MELFVSHEMAVAMRRLMMASLHGCRTASLANSSMIWISWTLLRDFKPDIMVIASWHIPAYRRVAREYANRCWRVMAMDNPLARHFETEIWSTLFRSFYVKPIADVVWLPGERQATFARKLGFSQSAILRGSFTCDQPAFEAVHTARIQQCEPLPRRFAFVGRMVADKCIDKLAEAYADYRKQRPILGRWSVAAPALCAPCLKTRTGSRWMASFSRRPCRGCLPQSGCLVLASRFEPWALVVHEAASAGRLILASENVGAVTHLVAARIQWLHLQQQ